MAIRKLFVPVVLMFVLSALASVAAAQDNWVKLGEKDVDFHVDHDKIVATGKGEHVREIRMQIRYAPVKFQRIVIHYKNGERQDVDFPEDVAMDAFTRTVAIEGNGRVIKDLDLWYVTDSLGGKKAKVTVFGRR